jgi:hypothetical protein
MSALRRNKALNDCPVFVDMVVKEFDQRLKMGKPRDRVKPLGQGQVEVKKESELYFCGV